MYFLSYEINLIGLKHFIYKKKNEKFYFIDTITQMKVTFIMYLSKFL